MESGVVMDPGQLAQRVIQGLRNNGETRPMHFDEDKFAILIGEVGSDSAAIANLQHIYHDCDNAPIEHHEEIIARYVNGWNKERAIPKDYAVAQPRLGVSIQHSGFFERYPGWIQWDLTSDLSAGLVDDDGDTLSYVPQALLSDWRVSREACMRDALRNLGKSAWTLEQIGHVFRSRAHDSYDAARLLFHDAFRALPLKGDPVVLVPDRDCLVVTGSDDVDGLKQVAATGHVRIEEASRLISGTPLILRGDTWEEFHPPAQTRVAFAHLARLYDAMNYGLQTSFLRDQSAGQDDNLLVAKVQVFKTGPDRYETFTYLPSVGQTLLPKVDHVVLHDLQTETTQLTPWADLFRVLGSKMPPVQLHPVRYRVESFPSQAERQEMGGTPRRMEANPPLRLRPRLR
jgi:hypothetical protein